MTKKQAKAHACLILASDAEHNAAGAVGLDHPLCKTSEDERRIAEAFDELCQELARRGRSEA